MTRLLLSSSTSGFSAEKAFRCAKELDISGVELMPFRWHNTSSIDKLVDKYGVNVEGVHLPFWWETKNLWNVMESEKTYTEKAFACLWKGIIGAGHDNSPAMNLSRHFKDSYLLIHPDVYHQMPDAYKILMKLHLNLKMRLVKILELTFSAE